MTTLPTPDATRTVPLIPRDRLMALVLAGVVLAIGSWWLVGGVCGVYHDDAIYVITGKALADGDGYRLINLPDRPFQTKYPILLPAVFAVVWLLWPSFPENLVVMQGICLLSAAASVGLGYLYVVRYRYFPRGVAAGAALVCATAPLFVYYASLTLSEMPFALLVVVACWCFDAALSRAPASRVRQIALGAVLSLPFWCRTVGLALVPAGLLLLHRAGRPKRWVTAGAAAALLPWVVWVAVGLVARQSDDVEGYYTNYLSWYSALGLPLAVRVFATNLTRMIWSTAGLGLEGCNRALVQLGVAPVLLLLSLGLIAWVPLIGQCRRGRVLPTMLTAYLLLVSFWPWPPDRFMIPILPLLIGYTLLGVTLLLKHRESQRSWRFAGMAALCLVLAANMICLSRYRSLSHRTGFPQNRLVSDPVRWGAYQRQFDWLRVHTATETVIATEMDPMFYLYTARRGFRPFVSRPGAMFYGSHEPLIGTVDELVAALQSHRPQYVVVTPMQFFDEPFVRLVQQLRRRHPDWLEPVYRDSSDPRFAIFQVRGAALARKNASSWDLPRQRAPAVE